jgi:hypothetical protein
MYAAGCERVNSTAAEARVNERRRGTTQPSTGLSMTRCSHTGALRRHWEGRREASSAWCTCVYRYRVRRLQGAETSCSGEADATVSLGDPPLSSHHATPPPPTTSLPSARRRARRVRQTQVTPARRIDRHVGRIGLAQSIPGRSSFLEWATRHGAQSSLSRHDQSPMPACMLRLGYGASSWGMRGGTVWYGVAPASPISIAVSQPEPPSPLIQVRLRPMCELAL